MARTHRPLPPLDSADLERIALRYVERFATTRAKLADYLRRKLRERGWDGDTPADPDALADRMVARGYVDDAAYAAAKARSMARRGLGARRVAEALRHAGVDDAAAPPPDDDPEAAAMDSALVFARRRRIGPFASAPADPDAQRRQFAAMLRAGHAPNIARKIVKMFPGEGEGELSR